MVHRCVQRHPAHHVQHGVVQPPVATDRRAQRVDGHAQHRAGGPLLAHARILGIAGTRRWRAPHQATDLGRLVGEVVLHRQSAHVLQHREQVDHLRVVARRPQPLRHLAGQPHPIEQRGHVGGMGLVERAGPGPQHQRGAAHTVQPQHLDAASDRQDRTAAAQCAAHLGAVDGAQQLAGQPHVLNHDFGQFVRALTLQRGQLGRTAGATRHRRQQAHRAHAVQQQQDGPAAGFAVDPEPTVQCALQGARIAVALALLAVSRTVDDGAQGLVHHVCHGEGQAHDVAAQRGHALDDLAGIGQVERRHTAQAIVQQQPHRQHVALGRPALCRQAATVTRWWQRHAQPQQAAVRALAQHQVAGLQIVVGDTGFVGKSQALQRFQHPRHQRGRRKTLGAQILGQRDAGAPVIGDVGPAFVFADLDHVGQAGVVDARGPARVVQPTLQRFGAGLAARHRQHQLLIDPGIGHQPKHRARALADQPQELKAPEVSDGVGRRRAGWRVGCHGLARGDYNGLDTNPVSAKAGTATAWCSSS